MYGIIWWHHLIYLTQQSSPKILSMCTCSPATPSKSAAAVCHQVVVSSLVMAQGGPTPDLDQLPDGAQECFPCLTLISLQVLGSLEKLDLCQKMVWLVPSHWLFYTFFRFSFGTDWNHQPVVLWAIWSCFPQRLLRAKESLGLPLLRVERVLLKVWTWEIQVLPSFTSVDIVTMWIEALL